MKKNISFNYHYDISDRDTANLMVCFIVAYDTMTTFMFCIVRILITDDVLGAMRVYDLVAIVLILIIPFILVESPYWLM